MKKIMYLVVFLMICFINTIPSYAISGSVEKVDSIYKTYNTNGVTSYTRSSSYKLYVGGVLTYCITPGVLFKTGEGYYEGEYSGLTDEIKKQMEIISYYGYGYKTHNSTEYYLATQELIHNLLGYTVIYNDGNINFDTYKTEINNLVNKHYVLPTIDDNLSLVKLKEYSFVDTNDVINNFNIEHSDNIDISVERNILHIRLLNDEEGYIYFYKGYDDATKYYLKDNSQTVAKFSLNKELMKTITITKKDTGRVEVTDQNRATFEGIEGTKYNLLDKNFNKIDTKVTNENGYLIFDGEYEYDKYYVEEVEVRDYPRNEYLIIVDLNSNLFTAPFFHGKLGSIKVKNIDEKGNKLNGAFEITSPDFYGMGFDDLIVGTYYIKQTSVEEGYIIDEKAYEVKITKEDLNQEITIINKKIVGNLIINNEDEEGNKLNGTFEVRNKNQEVVDINYLVPGTYYVKQTSVEEGYIIDEKVYEVKITKEDLNQEITIINKKIVGNLIINNEDEEGNKLNGTFEVRNKNQEVVDINYLVPGTYYVKQTSVEEGYIIDEEVYEVKITKEDLNQEITIINKKHIVYNEEKLPKTGYSNLTFIISIFFILIGYKLRHIN